MAGGSPHPRSSRRVPRRHRRLSVQPLPERRHLHRRGQRLRVPLPAQLRRQPLRERWGTQTPNVPPSPAETPVGTPPSCCPFGDKLGRGHRSRGRWGPLSVPTSLQTPRAATTTGTSSKVTVTATSPAGAPGRTRSGIAGAAPATSPASTRRRSTASSTVRPRHRVPPAPQASAPLGAPRLHRASRGCFSP